MRTSTLASLSTPALSLACLQALAACQPDATSAPAQGDASVQPTARGQESAATSRAGSARVDTIHQTEGVGASPVDMAPLDADNADHDAEIVVAETSQAFAPIDLLESARSARRRGLLTRTHAAQRRAFLDDHHCWQLGASAWWCMPAQRPSLQADFWVLAQERTFLALDLGLTSHTIGASPWTFGALRIEGAAVLTPPEALVLSCPGQAPIKLTSHRPARTLGSRRTSGHHLPRGARLWQPAPRVVLGHAWRERASGRRLAWIKRTRLSERPTDELWRFDEEGARVEVLRAHAAPPGKSLCILDEAGADCGARARFTVNARTLTVRHEATGEWVLQRHGEPPRALELLAREDALDSSWLAPHKLSRRADHIIYRPDALICGMAHADLNKGGGSTP